MSYTNRQYKAIGMWAERNNAIPQLSTPSIINFKDRTTGKISSVHLSTLMTQFENARKETEREKARERRNRR